MSDRLYWSIYLFIIFVIMIGAIAGESFMRAISASFIAAALAYPLFRETEEEKIARYEWKYNTDHGMAL
jgi:hypothetical protein